MRARVAAGAALLALTGCGGGASGAEDPSAVASKTAANLPDIRSGDMRVELAATGRGGGQTAKLGFRLEGPFALARDGGLPVAKLRYTQLAGGRQGSATFISTGREAFVDGGGSVRALPAAQTRRLRAAAGQVSQGGGVKKLDLARWMRDPRLDAGPAVGGDATDRIRGRVDVPAVAKDLAGSLGDTRELERAIKGARVEVLTGAKDRLLRRLTLNVDLALDVPNGMRRQLGELVGGDVLLVFEVADPNRKVSVPRPATG
ncbi:MAG: hypothetical protein ABI611_05170 [Solirubrobacteraceae bacterium]